MFLGIKSYYKLIVAIMLMSLTAVLACQAFDIPTIKPSSRTSSNTGGQGGGSVQILETITQNVRANQGATLVLPGGSRVSISPGILPADTSVTLSLLTGLPKHVPADWIISVGPALSLTFNPARRSDVPRSQHVAFAQDPSSIEFQIEISEGTVRGFDSSAAQGYMPALYLDSVTNAGLLFVHGQVDSRKVIGKFFLEYCSFGLSGMSGPVTLFFTAMAISNPGNWISPVYGGYVLKGNRWSPFPEGFINGKKTLVLVHGILSSVQKAYGSSCYGWINIIADHTGCQNIVGYNYPFTKGLVQSSQSLARFLKELTDRKVPCIIVDAHSYGVPTSLGALSTSGIRTVALVGRGGPIMGTSAATTAPLLMTALAHSFMDGGIVLDSEAVHSLKDLVNSTWATDVAPGSELPRGYARAFNYKHPETDIILVAGTRQPRLLSSITPCIFGDEINDGVINLSSAMGNGSGLRNIKYGLEYPLIHTELQCTTEVNRKVDEILRLINVPCEDVPVISFEASNECISKGNSSELKWSISGATTITIDPDSRNVLSNGTWDVSPTTTTTYTLTATNSVGSVEATVTIVVLPDAMSFRADHRIANAGERCTLYWDVEGVDTVSIDHGVGSNLPPNGEIYVYPADTTTYTLTAMHHKCKLTAQVQIQVPSKRTYKITTISNPDCLIVPCGTTEASYPSNTQGINIITVKEHSSACFQIIPADLTALSPDELLKCTNPCETCSILVDGLPVNTLTHTLTDIIADHTISLSCSAPNPTPSPDQDLVVQVWVDNQTFTVSQPINIHYSSNQPANLSMWIDLPDGTRQNYFLNQPRSAGTYNFAVVAGTPIGPRTVTITGVGANGKQASDSVSYLVGSYP